LDITLKKESDALDHLTLLYTGMSNQPIKIIIEPSND
jgi:hypothetical protein